MSTNLLSSFNQDTHVERMKQKQKEHNIQLTLNSNDYKLRNATLLTEGTFCVLCRNPAQEKHTTLKVS